MRRENTLDDMLGSSLNDKDNETCMMRRYSSDDVLDRIHNNNDDDHELASCLCEDEEDSLSRQCVSEEEEEEEEELGMVVSPMMMDNPTASINDNSCNSLPLVAAPRGSWSTSTQPSPPSPPSPSSLGSACSASPLLLLSLPVDSLHSIASFCSCEEWANFGLSSHGSNRACREVFKRVKMHGFRCAFEVIASWERGQQSDARELCALYIKNKVPIHPLVLGHAYHTLEWRMNVEAQNEHGRLDPFYAHRHEARHTEQYYSKTLTYLEEKCLFHKHLKIKDKGIMSAERRQSLNRRFPPHKHAPPTHLKISVPTHRHLLDQHLLSNPGACDDNLLQTKNPFCLSADFFHPLPLLPLHPELMPDISLEVYSCTSLQPQSNTMKIMFRYQKKLLALLHRHDTAGFDECLLDFWDEFFPMTRGVYMYDKATPVPRMSGLEHFLTRPCPPSWGSIQCEIERIKTSSKKKIKGRFFPTYEYRLFLRDRRFGQPESQVLDDDKHNRHDTVVMVARHNRHTKRGVNSYCLYMPESSDAQSHYSSVNAKTKTTTPQPSFPQNDLLSTAELGRLQSNFIGTEFQIFTPEHPNKQPTLPMHHHPNHNHKSQSPPNGPRWRRIPCSLSRPKLRSTVVCEDEDNSITTNNSNSSNKPMRTRTSRRAIADATATTYGSEELECGAITYTANLLGNRPRIMDVCIPKVNAGEQVVSNVWRNHVDQIREDTNNTETMLTRFKQIQLQQQQQQQDNSNTNPSGTDADGLGLTALQNRPPWWNIDLGAFVLNFGGRVSVASVKNFQLCDKNNQEHIMLQFGRIQGRHSFTMDFQYPLSPIQAFAIAISSLQSKISFG